MNVTAKTMYGLRTLIDIAFHDKGGPVQRRHIALRQSIPTDYMDQILLRLRATGFVHSLRGREGGYHLAVDPEEITVWDVVRAVEDEGYIVKDSNPVPEAYQYASEHLTEPAVDFVTGLIERQFKKYTLGMFLEEADDRLLEAGMDPFAMLVKKPRASRKKAAATTTNSTAYTAKPSAAGDARVVH